MFVMKNFSGKLNECECCGAYRATSKSIFFNDVLIWEEYFDGHMGGSRTELPLYQCILNAWKEYALEIVENQHTEEARHEWNEKHPGNLVASTKEYWEEDKLKAKDFCNENYEELLDVCKVLPYDEYRQLKMVALWIEEIASDKIEVKEEMIEEK